MKRWALKGSINRHVHKSEALSIKRHNAGNADVQDKNNLLKKNKNVQSYDKHGVRSKLLDTVDFIKFVKRKSQDCLDRKYTHNNENLWKIYRNINMALWISIRV